MLSAFATPEDRLPTVTSQEDFISDPEISAAISAGWDGGLGGRCRRHPPQPRPRHTACGLPGPSPLSSSPAYVWDLIVVGAGVAGSALAYGQAKVRADAPRRARAPAGAQLAHSWQHGAPAMACTLAALARQWLV